MTTERKNIFTTTNWEYVTRNHYIITFKNGEKAVMLKSYFEELYELAEV